MHVQSGLHGNHEPTVVVCMYVAVNCKPYISMLCNAVRLTASFYRWQAKGCVCVLFSGSLTMQLAQVQSFGLL